MYTPPNTVYKVGLEVDSERARDNGLSLTPSVERLGINASSFSSSRRTALTERAENRFLCFQISTNEMQTESSYLVFFNSIIQFFHSFFKHFTFTHFLAWFLTQSFASRHWSFFCFNISLLTRRLLTRF